MASLSRSANDTYTIQFMATDGRRRSVRLGQVSSKSAEEFRRRVEFLFAARSTNTAIDADTAKWLVGLSDLHHGRLAAVGLVAPRNIQTKSLKDFTDEYIDSRVDVKPQTTINMKNSAARLVEYFQADRLMGSILPGDADEFCAWLRGRYAQATAARTIKRAKQFFRAAYRKGVVARNPFEDCKPGHMKNRSRIYFISHEVAAAVMASCRTNHWRLLFALARFGGLRMPSEALMLEWSDVDWARSRIKIRSPKKENDENAGVREIPLFPELRPCLEEAKRVAKTPYVVEKGRNPAANWRTNLDRIIRRAGLEPWPRRWQNLRASRETELAAVYPIHIVCHWMGNQAAVAAAHYLTVKDEDYERAALAKSGAQDGQNAVRSGTITSLPEPSSFSKTLEKSENWRLETAQDGSGRVDQMPLQGLEINIATSLIEKHLRKRPGSQLAKSGVNPREMAQSELLGLWSNLDEVGQYKILVLARRLAKESGGVKKNRMD